MIPEAEFLSGEIAVCSEAGLARVRQAAAESPRRRARLCLHAGLSDQLHEMLIVLLRGTVIPIHRHPAKSECYHLLEGLLTLKIHHDAGGVIREIPLGGRDSGRPFLCRIAAGLWHSVEVESDEVVMHESTTGPFSPGDTEYLTPPIG